MSKELEQKQIEEIDTLETVLYEANHKKSVLDYRWLATEVYNAGYRRQSENVIELPCAIGTTIYELIFEKEDPCSWCEHDHSGFGDYICDFDYAPYPDVKDFLSGEAICPKNEMKVTDKKFDLVFYHYNKDWFNITWFLTKEEAEQTLAKMKAVWNEKVIETKF